MSFKKIPHETSRAIWRRFEPSEQAMALNCAELPPAETVALLREHQLYNDLVQFLCHGLPVREVIWWAALALELRQSDWMPQEQQAIADAKRWVLEPQESLRRKAEWHVNQFGLERAPGWLAQAVFWNGSGSIVAAEHPVVLPPEFLYAKAAAGAINMAAVLPQWDQSERYYAQVIAMGIDLANGGRGNSEEAA